MSGFWVHTVFLTYMRIARNMREIIYACMRTRLANNFKYGCGTQSNRFRITSSEAKNPLCLLVTWDVSVTKFLTCHATICFATGLFEFDNLFFIQEYAKLFLRLLKNLRRL